VGVARRGKEIGREAKRPVFYKREIHQNRYRISSALDKRSDAPEGFVEGNQLQMVTAWEVSIFRAFLANHDGAYNMALN
jgi:hypothetical protein